MNADVDGSEGGAVAPSDPPATSVEVQAGLRTALPACMAYVPLGMALGVLVVQSGLAWWWAPLFGGLIYAGSLEFLLVGMVAVAAPLAHVAVSAFLVNFRHVFYALSFPLDRVRGRGWRAYSTFALTDEAYALAASGDSQRWTGTRIITIQVFLQVVWVCSVAAGAGVGLLIPPWVRGLEFAVTALFAVLAMDAFRVRRSVPVPVVALLCAMVGAVATPDQMLVTGMALFVAALTASFFWDRRGRAGGRDVG